MMIKENAYKSFFWRLFERTGAQIVSFIVSIVLARILIPEEYGLIAISTIVTTFLNVFIDSGLGNALIQKKEVDELDFSTVFWANMMLCIILYCILYFLSPFIAIFYNNITLIYVLRVMGIAIIISGVKNIQQAFVSRTLQFKKFFYSTLGGTIFSAIIGIYMAEKGAGIWALVAQYLSNTAIDTIILWVTLKWRPSFSFSFIRFKILFSFGYKILLSSLINNIYSNFRQLIVGKLYNSSELAYYNRGKQFPEILMTNINTSIDSVLFPIMSKKQDDKDNLRKMASKSLIFSGFILFPLLSGLFVTADYLIPIVLTPKWCNCIPFTRIFCIMFSFFPIQTTNLNIIKSMGQSALYLKLEILQTLNGIILLLIGLKKGPLFIALLYLISTMLNSIIIVLYSGKLIRYGIIKQFKDILPYYVMSVFMGMCVFFMGKFTSGRLGIFLQILSGIVIYILEAIVFKPYAYIFLISFIYKKKQKN